MSAKKRKGTKTRRPAVYVKRGEKCWCGKPHTGNAGDRVSIPVARDGARITGMIGLCYKQFSRITGIKLKSGEVAKVRITGKKIKE